MVTFTHCVCVSVRGGGIRREREREREREYKCSGVLFHYLTKVPLTRFVLPSQILRWRPGVIIQGSSLGLPAEEGCQQQASWTQGNYFHPPHTQHSHPMPTFTSLKWSKLSFQRQKTMLVCVCTCA